MNDVQGRHRSAWVSLLDSGRWRRVTKSRVGASVLNSRAYGSVDMARRYVTTEYKSRRDPSRFADVRTVCLVVGHVKSGGSLLGSLLDAHPDALISDEIGLIHYLDAGFGRDQLFYLVQKGSRREAEKGRVTARRLGGYSLAVAGQHQGHADELRVIGDVRAGPTTRLLGERPELLAAFRQAMAPSTTRVVHVVRNPFDPISAQVIRGKRSVANATDDYAGQCDRLVGIRKQMATEELLTVRYERLISDPVAELARVCAFLGLPTNPGYLSDCAAIIDADRVGERSQVDWDAAAIAEVHALIDRTGFLEGYQWG